MAKPIDGATDQTARRVVIRTKSVLCDADRFEKAGWRQVDDTSKRYTNRIERTLCLRPQRLQRDVVLSLGKSRFALTTGVGSPPALDRSIAHRSRWCAQADARRTYDGRRSPPMPRPLPPAGRPASPVGRSFATRRLPSEAVRAARTPLEFPRAECEPPQSPRRGVCVD
jgi:hypothetical protein